MENTSYDTLLPRMQKARSRVNGVITIDLTIVINAFFNRHDADDDDDDDI